MSDHDHEHDEFHEPTDSEVRAKAVESLLAEKGLLSTDAVDEIVNQYENDVQRQTPPTAMENHDGGC